MTALLTPVEPTMAKNIDVRYWCEHCKVFIYNNKINRDKHENSPQHKANFRKKVELLREEEKKYAVKAKSHLKHSDGSSFYSTTTLKDNRAEIPVQVRSSFISPKSTGLSKTPILGLSSSTLPSSKCKDSISTNYSITPPVRRDVKSVTSDLKRKIADDEINSTTFSKEKPVEVRDDSETKEQDISNLFKKKKKA